MEPSGNAAALLVRAEEVRREVALEKLDSPEAAERFRIRYLGQRRGIITHLLGRIKELPPADRRDVGRQLNELRKLASERHRAAAAQMPILLRTDISADPADLRQRLTVAPLDLTLPGRQPVPPGSLHPITQTLETITGIFARMGFVVAEGPEIEDDWHNFTALNFPPDHPARDMQDTLFLEESDRGHGGVMLRTHTSPVQIRAMMAGKPPFRLIAPGRVYRNETITYKSFCLFHQIEGLVVDEGVTMADLKHALFTFARAYFGEDVRLRFRPSFFPFTEPSAELDIWWPLPQHPEGGHWMEILGSGMVDPHVLDAVGIDSERYTGYAFGMGVERPAMLRYGIEDIRVFFENDVRFLAQFQ